MSQPQPDHPRTMFRPPAVSTKTSSGHTPRCFPTVGCRAARLAGPRDRHHPGLAPCMEVGNRKKRSPTGKVPRAQCPLQSLPCAGHGFSASPAASLPRKYGLHQTGGWDTLLLRPYSLLSLRSSHCTLWTETNPMQRSGVGSAWSGWALGDRGSTRRREGGREG